MPYRGVRMLDLRAICKRVFAEHQIASSEEVPWSDCRLSVSPSTGELGGTKLQSWGSQRVPDYPALPRIEIHPEWIEQRTRQAAALPVVSRIRFVARQGSSR